jgi:hypothetical protein
MVKPATAQEVIGVELQWRARRLTRKPSLPARSREVGSTLKPGPRHGVTGMIAPVTVSIMISGDF